MMGGKSILNRGGGLSGRWELGVWRGLDNEEDRTWEPWCRVSLVLCSGKHFSLCSDVYRILKD